MAVEGTCGCQHCSCGHDGGVGVVLRTDETFCDYCGEERTIEQVAENTVRYYCLCCNVLRDEDCEHRKAERKLQSMES